MLIDTLETKKLLTNTYGFTDEHAEGIVRAISQSEDKVATKEDIDLLRRDLGVLRKDVETLEHRLLASMNRRVLALFVAVLGGMWGLLELYL